VFYLGADAAALTPTLQTTSESYVFATRPAAEVDLVRMVAEVQQMEPGPDALGRPVYDVPHLPRPWGGKVSAYLWTKSVAAGTLMVSALAALAGAGPASFLLGPASPLLALLFLALTAGLLVADLKRPDRFHYILLEGNWASWLVKGAWILVAYGLLAAVWLLAAGGHADGLQRLLALPVGLLAAGAAGYSAFLFGQAEGRDFWQSPLLLPQLLLAALRAGSASLLVVGALAGAAPGTLQLLAWLAASALVVEGLVFFAELGGTHATVDVARAARLVTRGGLARRFWIGAVGAGLVLPLALFVVFPAASVIGVVAALLALAGLWIYEDLWVKAGQSIPLS
jgi:Ni/Fe-hydrogenase subunit HybB-like protein